jgi:transcriptional regulator with XRE-family HTH domain
MDVPLLLTRARHRAELSRDQLAVLAGTSRSALSAYEGGRRSPTVATLDRLLAACGLQIRPELEPYLADLDAAVDRLLDGTPTVPSGCARLADRLTAAGLTWAFDGSTALALQGLAVEAPFPDVVAVGNDRLRRFCHELGLEATDADGGILWDSWLDRDLTRVVPSLVWTRYGAFTMRIVSELDVPVQVRAAGCTWPVLGLLAVEQAQPAVADVLARLRHRRTVGA